MQTPGQIGYTALVNDIKEGEVKIPQFQREFVWSLQKSANLLDSILKGYPIGSFIFWRTREELRVVRNIGGIELPPLKKREFVNYVIDGQQRLTSFFAALNGEKIKRQDGKVDDFSRLHIDLSAQDGGRIVVIDANGYAPEAIIGVQTLLTGKVKMLARKYTEEYLERIDTIRSKMHGYQFSRINLPDKTPLDVATEIFTRLNIGGEPLTTFEIMVAKTYDHARNFDLAEKYEELRAELNDAGRNYGTIPPISILQTISLIIANECKRQTMLGLDKQKFISEWNTVADSIRSTVDYFRSAYRIPVSELLPYKSLIVPFTYFFRKHESGQPSTEQAKLLREFFWRSAFAGRYSYATESKLAQDIRIMDSILQGKEPTYSIAWAVDISPQWLKDNGLFNTGRSFVKAMLCLYAYQLPKSFKSDAPVFISNEWLKRSNSKNYHHFFPLGFMKGKGRKDEANNVLNITIVDDFLNKREISDKAPSKYMCKFSKGNKSIAETMKSHLIGDLDAFGVWGDDYDKFIKQRAKAVSQALGEWIPEREIDKQGSGRVDDSEENFTE